MTTMIRRIFLLCSVVALSAAVHAQERPAGAARLTIEDALGWRIASNPKISPDGRRIAYLVTENDFERSRVVTQLWWVEVESRRARRLTTSEDVVIDPRWSPDGRWLAFLVARGGTDGRPKAQVWLLPADGGDSFSLTRAPEGVRHYRWAPDSSSVYYVAQEPRPTPTAALLEERQKRRMDSVVVEGEKFRREIWRVGLESRRAERIFAGDLGLDSIEVSPDGKWIAYRSNLTGDPDHAMRYDVWVLELITRRVQPLVRRGGEEKSLAWSPDSTRVAFLAPRVPEIRYSQDEVFVVSLPVAGEPPEPKLLPRDFTGDIERLQWTGKGESIVFAAAVRTGNRLYALSVADGALRSASTESTFVTAPDWNPDGSLAAAVLEGPTLLPEIVLIRAVAGEPQRLTEFSNQLRGFALGAQELIRWKSKDGMEIEGLLTKPPGWVATQKYPLLLDIHGGPHSRRSNTLLSGNWPQVWAARGWLVLQPNFRGSSAYGHEFGIASRGDIGGKDFDDILAGVDYVLSQGWADADRMAAMGGSYGGYMTNLLIGRTKRFRAAASFYGIFNLITDFSNSDLPSWEFNYLTKYYWEDLDLYVDRSPMKYVTSITTPVLILHGDEDNNTFISNSKEMYNALKQLGRTVKFVRFPREGHGFREPNHRLEQFRHVASWLEQHVPGVATARGVADAVRFGGWELRVAGIRATDHYAGVRARGRFVEVELVIQAVQPTSERFSLLVFDTAGSEIVLATPERNLYPEGVVAESLGQRVLAKSSAQVVAFVPDADGNHSAMAVAVAFDAPAAAREFTLRVKDFPPIRLDLPAEAGVR